jgi:hypothetical protein
MIESCSASSRNRAFGLVALPDDDEADVCQGCGLEELQAGIEAVSSLKTLMQDTHGISFVSRGRLSSPPRAIQVISVQVQP